MLTLLPQQVPDGFISHFYSVSEHVSPILAFGFLGPKPQLAEVCAFFKVSSECCGHCHHLGPACCGPGDWNPGKCQVWSEGLGLLPKKGPVGYLERSCAAPSPGSRAHGSKEALGGLWRLSVVVRGLGPSLMPALYPSTRSCST